MKSLRIIKQKILRLFFLMVLRDLKGRDASLRGNHELWRQNKEAINYLTKCIKQMK